MAEKALRDLHFILLQEITTDLYFVQKTINNTPSLLNVSGAGMMAVIKRNCIQEHGIWRFTNVSLILAKCNTLRTEWQELCYRVD